MIQARKGKRGTTYRVTVYTANGERSSQTFKSKTLAKESERRMLLERDERQASGMTVNDSITLEEFSARWLKEKVEVRLSPSTQTNYRRALKVHINPLFGKLRLRELRVDHGNRLVSTLKASGHVPKGINNILGVFQSLLNDAVSWDCLIRNPLAKFKSVKEPELHFDYWSGPEIQQFLAATIFDPYQPLYVIALNTGMRRGEICGLRWDRVDFSRKQIVVSRSLSRYGLSDTTKSGKRRYVPMNGVVLELIRRLSRERRCDYVLSPGVHQPDDVHHVYRDFHRAQKRAGFDRLIRFHDLRHTFASHFMMNGGNIYDLQKILGHSTLDMTQRYAHMSPDHLSNSIKIVSFGPPLANGGKLESSEEMAKVKTLK